MNLILLRLFAAIEIDTSPLPKPVSDSSLIINIFNIIFGILAGIAFISIVYGGFRYVTSRGEPANTAKAKDIILYSIIGLAVTFSAFGIVNLLLNTLVP